MINRSGEQLPSRTPAEQAQPESLRLHHEAGLTTGDADEAAMKRTLARRAADTYVLASAEKIGAASRFLVLPLAQITGL